MWHFISEKISDNIHQDFICDDIREVNGGDTHRAYKISDGRKRFFVKVDHESAQSNFAAEAQSLTLLQQAADVKIPKVICTGVANQSSYLVLEHINLSDGENNDWYEMGKQLAKLHLHTEQHYGCHFNNFIGKTQQINPWTDDWASFFSDFRIGKLLQLMAKKGIQFVDIDRATEQIYTHLKGYQPKASLLHGDLWRGNVAFFNHAPVIFDPASYFGDRETDLAMTELFGTFPQSFYQGYEAIWPLSDGYQQRKPIYQLYHILNHALMFGGHYLDSAKATLQNIQKH